MALISVVIMSCGGKNNDANAEADAYLESIRKYEQISLNEGQTSVDVYVKKGEKPDGIYDIEDFFYISFIDADAPKYNGKRFLDHRDSKIDDKGKLINKPLRHYIIHIDKGEEMLEMNIDHVRTTKRTINIHYIYE